MAMKTMLRQLISKWGIMSIDLQTAVDKDMAVIHEDGSAEYVENDQEEENEMRGISYGKTRERVSARKS